MNREETMKVIVSLSASYGTIDAKADVKREMINDYMKAFENQSFEKVMAIVARIKNEFKPPFRFWAGDVLSEIRKQLPTSGKSDTRNFTEGFIGAIRQFAKWHKSEVDEWLFPNESKEEHWLKLSILKEMLAEIEVAEKQTIKEMQLSGFVEIGGLGWFKGYFPRKFNERFEARRAEIETFNGVAKLSGKAEGNSHIAKHLKQYMSA